MVALSSLLAIEGKKKMSNPGDFSFPSVTKQLLFSNWDISTGDPKVRKHFFWEIHMDCS